MGAEREVLDTGLSRATAAAEQVRENGGPFASPVVEGNLPDGPVT